MNVRMRRLQADYEQVRQLAHAHPRIEVEGVVGNPPDRYRILLTVRSLREKGDQVVVAKRHRLEVVLPRTYPRDAPICRMLTPVFHPNIAPHAVCIGDHWSAAESLSLMIQRVGEMLSYQSYNTKSPLNGRAAQWVEENEHRVPLEKEDFFLDLSSAPTEARAACKNCGATTRSAERPLAECESGHPLCEDCISRCGECGRVICLICGDRGCVRCHPVCTNCGAADATAHRCAAGHTACEDCAARCASCGRRLCIICAEITCPECEPAA